MTIIIPRRAAAIKLAAATRVVYRFKGGSKTYDASIPVSDLVAAFKSNPKMKLKVQIEDSSHVVVNPGSDITYLVTF